MKTLQLTPGTGNFYCGNCIRDNALVLALRELGHTCTLVPMYLPMVTETPAESHDTEVHFGGVNAFLQEKWSLFRKAPRWIDRLFNSRWMLKMAAKRAGMTKASELGEMTLSMLRGEQGRQSKEIDKLVEWIAESSDVSTVGLSNCLLMGLARRIKQELNIPVVCTLMGEDAFVNALPPKHRDAVWAEMAERANDIDAFIAVSDYYAGIMKKNMSLPDDKVHVVHNGIDLDGFTDAAPSAPSEPALGFFARQCYGKGLHTVVDAFIDLKQRDTVPNLKLRVAGTKTEADDDYINQQKKKLEDAGLTEQAAFRSNLSRQEKVEHLQSLSVLSVPCNYGESFGMYVIEAMAAGVPVVQPRHGAFPEIVEATGGGVLFEPEDPKALADAVAELLNDEPRRASLGEAGRKAVRERFSVSAMAKNVAAVHERVIAKQRGDQIGEASSKGAGQATMDKATTASDGVH